MKIYDILASRKGFSLVELIVALTMMMIMLPSSIVALEQVMQYKTIAEARITSVHLAQMVLEHETQKRFSSVQTIEPANFEDANITIGGAVVPNPYLDNDLVHEFINYNFEVQVACVWDGVDGLNPNLDAWTADPECTGRSKEFKRVNVIVTNPVADTVHLTTLVTDTSDPVCGGHTVSDPADCLTGEISCAGSGAAAGQFFCVQAGCDCPEIH